MNGWVNNRKGGDLRGLRAHYDVIVMQYGFCIDYFTFFVLRGILRLIFHTVIDKTNEQ